MSRQPSQSNRSRAETRSDTRTKTRSDARAHGAAHKADIAQAGTSWDPVAQWYARWTGADGSEYHRSIAIPAVLDLLQPQRRELIADIGCGTGVLASSLPEGVRYVGIDASPRLLSTARRAHGARRGHGKVNKRGTSNTFVLADAANLAANDKLQAGSADGAVFLLSIQDMEPLPDILASAAWLLKEAGRLVILMLHPCFRIPRQSGWGWEEGRGLQYRRVDSYLSPRSVPVRPIAKGKPGSIMAYHVPLQEYINGLLDAGFRIDRFVEIPAYPGITRKGKRAKAENRANSEIPLFLAIKALRL